ncbi:MAG: TonB-dependent receptor [Gammaproteobacteria bacterium]|jgi:iron complex outermembrane receptor protein|nr:TonB-dependent receptor [Gammaproteobacteria bacterium]
MRVAGANLLQEKIVDIKFTKQPKVAISLISALVVALPQQVLAQEESIEEIVTTGTRAKARSVEDSPAPVDVLSGEYFRNQGDTDLQNLVRNIVPSYNVNVQPISDAATVVRPANLRGLAPDHTLVLINGKRRHRAAVIYWLGNGVANGAQGPDISMIPSIALKQVEVLRDGAAAQYGSDAIAGVMNFILKDDAEGLTVEGKWGQYQEGDGDKYSVAANLGLPLTDAGYANFSFEYGESDPTSRSVQRDDAAALIAAGNTDVLNPAQVWGSPLIEDDIKFWGNLGLDLGNGNFAYAYGNHSEKFVDGGFYFRNPNTRSAVFSGDDGESLLIGDLQLAEGGAPAGCPAVPITDNVPDADALAEVFARDECFSFQEIFPGGFTPRFGGNVSDQSLVAGVRGEMDNGLRWDFSAGFGRNEVDFFIRNTVNASLGPATPTSFDPGAYTQLENMVNLDFGYSPTENTNLAFGAEYRLEEFEITVGQEESFLIGPLAPQGFSAASNGFPGFSNIAGGKFDRRNTGLYVDGEWEPTDSLLLGAAVRFEDFQDFGTTTNYKVAANWRITDNFGLRGTASTGFKAPTPGQSNAFNVSTEFDLAIQELVNNGTVPSTTAVAQLRGGRPLEPEESTNFTLGTFFSFGNLDITLDYFKVDVDDRLNLSQNFQLTQEEIDDLIEQGITSAGNLQNFRFFVNDFDTETEGFDIVATYPLEWSNASTDLSLAYNQTTTEVAKFNPVTIDDTRILQIEKGLPESRWNLQANHFWNNWRFLGRISYYDDWYDSEDGEFYSGKSILDLEAAYTWNENTTIVLGMQNALDETPDDNPSAAAGVGNKYSQYSPFGFNGGFWYLRVTWHAM